MPQLFKHIVIGLIFFSSVLINAQDTLNSSNVEEVTYNLYLNKNWPQLVKSGNNALKKGFDYYYLRMRLGIACFEKGNYYEAEKHFNIALSFNSDDELVLEYLYFCHIYTSHFEEAKKLSKKFSKSLAVKLKTEKSSPIAYAIVEGGVKTTDSTKILGNGYYFHFGVGHYVLRSFSLFHGGTYYSQSFADHYGGTGLSTQLQYYLKATIPLKNNWQISPAFHFISKTNTYHIKNISAMPPPPPPGMPPPPPPSDTYRDSSANNSYVVSSFSVRKSINHFDFTLGTTLSNVFGNEQFQHSASIQCSPLKKDKIIIGLIGFAHTEDSYKNTYLATVPFVVINPVSKLSLFASYLNNPGGSNIIESNGYIVNNSTDLTPFRLQLMGSVSVTKQFDIYVLFQHEKKEQQYLRNVYHFNLMLIGVKFKP